MIMYVDLMQKLYILKCNYINKNKKIYFLYFDYINN